MPSRVYNNIQDHRVLDDKKVVEDVTKVGLPTIKHPVTSMTNISGMAMDVDMPDTTHVEAMDVTLYHNNGTNCQYLANPGKHKLEIRTARQRFNVSKQDMEYESVKFLITCIHVETQKGDVETGSPYGSTEKYSILRYEEIVNGKTVIVIDATAGTIKYNGKNYTSAVEKLLK